MTLTFGSLFAGIGGMDLGLERAGMKCAWQVEIDDYATRVLAKHWPDVPRYRDVRDVGAHNLAVVDLICGGFPCQDISNAGKRAGIDGGRSGLWSEYARIVRELRPRYVLVENVAALLGRGIGRVLGDLAEIGYDAEWHCIPAAAVGAPHIRDRVFILAYAQRNPIQRDRESRELAREASTYQGTEEERERFWDAAGDSGQDVADATGPRLLPGAYAGIYSSEEGPRPRHEQPERSCWWATEPAVGRVAHGIPRRVDQLRGLGNAVVPQVAEYIGRRIVEATTP